MEERWSRWDSAGQGHIRAIYDSMDSKDPNKATLLNHISQFDLEGALNLWSTGRALLDAHQVSERSSETKELSIEPFRGALAFPERESPEKRAEWRNIGLEAIRCGQVCALTMAGGQGTRLGSAEPKGSLDIGLASHKCLFQLIAERLIRLSELAGGKSIKWFVMTSPATHRRTEELLEEKKWFGLCRDDVILFQQDEIPCFTLNGKIMLESPGKIATSPNGNGGIYKALETSGSLKLMKK